MRRRGGAIVVPAAPCSSEGGRRRQGNAAGGAEQAVASEEGGDVKSLQLARCGGRGPEERGLERVHSLCSRELLFYLINTCFLFFILLYLTQKIVFKILGM